MIDAGACARVSMLTHTQLGVMKDLVLESLPILPSHIGEFWDLGLRSCCQMRQIKPSFLGTKFVVKYWHAKHENRECCPQHGALSAFSVGLAFSAVTIAVSEPFLLPAAENWYPENPYVLAPSA